MVDLKILLFRTLYIRKESQGTLRALVFSVLLIQIGPGIGIQGNQPLAICTFCMKVLFHGSLQNNQLLQLLAPKPNTLPVQRLQKKDFGYEGLWPRFVAKLLPG